MRNVTVRLAPASEIRKGIRAPERFRPRPRIRALPPMRARPDGSFEIKLSDEDGWRRVHAMIVALHQSLVAGSDCDVAALGGVVLPHLPKPNRAVAEGVARSFVFSLYQTGYAEIDFEPPPPVFADRYERVKELGRGGMGVAHLCRDQQSGDLVVVKHAWGWSRAIESADATNREEAHVLLRFDHPRIPPVIDAFEHDGIFHMVRPYADGAPLAKAKPRLKDQPLHDRVGVVRHLAETLQYVHDEGYLYLDMKPSNAIMKDVATGPMLLDFGLCRPMVDGVVRTRGVVGSKGFIAPELKERVASVRTDVFALGRTWYQLASGRKARQGRSPEEYRARMEAARMPEEEIAAILRLTAADPAKRPATMREVIESLPA